MRKFFFLILLMSSHFSWAQSFTKTAVTTNLIMPISFELCYDGRIFITEKAGRIITCDTSGSNQTVFYDFGDTVAVHNEFGLLGITLDPDFQNNHFVYVFYNYIENPFGPSGDDRIRIQRFTDVNNAGTSPTIICDIDVRDGQFGNHTGGNIHFRPSDSTNIYVSIGDMASSALGPDSTYSQYLDNPFGKILRISKHPGAPPPYDNPFYDNGNPLTGNCDWIWAYGLRNPFDFCFSPLNDSLYATENGASFADEINLIVKGGNYGWPWCEGAFDHDTTTLPCHLSGAIDPILSFPFPVPALTGIILYTDSAWSQQTNHLIPGSYTAGDLVDVTLGNSPIYDTVVASSWWLNLTNLGGFTCIRQADDGCIYELEGGYINSPGLYKVCPTDVGIHHSVPESASDLKVYPNPASDQMTVKFTQQVEGNATISVIDAMGRTLFITSQNRQAGQNVLEFDLKSMNLENGLYCIQVNTPTGATSERILIARLP